MAAANRRWAAARNRLRQRRLRAIGRGAAAALGRNEVLLDHLQQLRDAQLIHAGPEVMSLGPQVFVHALGEPDGDDPGRLAFGVGSILLFPELDQPLLDLFELGALLES